MLLDSWLSGGTPNLLRNRYPQRSSNMKRAATKALIVAGAAAALVGIGGGTAAAGTRSTASTEWAVDAFHEYVKPSDSISIPTLSCGAGGYLKDADYSPGRIAPRGVEVVEPGGVGVTIT